MLFFFYRTSVYSKIFIVSLKIYKIFLEFQQLLKLCVKYYIRSWVAAVTHLNICFGRIFEGLWDTGLENFLSVQSLGSCCENFEDNVDSSADYSDLPGLGSF